MRVFRVIATTLRGNVSPPELLNDAGQYAANVQADSDDIEDRNLLRYRATAHVRFERDLPIAEHDELRRPAAVPVDRMIELARVKFPR